MNRIRNLAWLLLLTPGAPAQVQHTSQAETDRFLLCARNAFQKPVYTTIRGPWFEADMSCSPDRDEVIRELQQRKIPAFESESAVLLFPPEMRPDIGITYGDGRTVKWHKFKINVHVGNFRDQIPQGSRPLTRDEQDQIAKVILDQALTPPLVPGFAEVESDTATMEVELRLDAHQLSPGMESVVALFGSTTERMRLIYGELNRGAYRILWDTPLVGGDDLDYKDVDGDGVQEIVLRWTEVGGSASYGALAIFSLKGQELTRQKECYPHPHAELAQFACPIWGTDVEFEKTSSGKYDIVVIPNDQTNPQDAERYTLINGKYIRSEKLNGPATKKR